MFRRKWDAKSVISHIMSRRRTGPLSAHYFANAYPAVYAAAEQLFGSWGSSITACGLDYRSIRKYRVWSGKMVG